MRVAMCISGQLRDEELSLPLIANVARELKPKVFISTWKLRGTKTSGAMDQYQIRRTWGNELYFGLPARLVGGLSLPRAIPAFADLLEQQIRENEPPVTVESMEKYFDNPIVDIEDESKFCLDFVKPVTDVNSLRMLYKVWKCNELKRRHEKDTGQKFDIVVRLRPDFMLKPLAPDIMEAICQDPGKLMFVAQGRRSFVGDTVAVSGSAGADYYAALFCQSIARACTAVAWQP